MSFAKAENKSHQANAKTTANHSAGEKGISMPAVPVLQNRPAQLQAGEQDGQAQTQIPIDEQRQYADKGKRENIQPFQLAAQSAPPANPSAPNNTGLPDGLKKGVESLSGFDISDVKVHYNSPKPAQLQAFAYAQGTDIHVAPGQEKHIPHEAWHVVQQKQGRVQPTVQLKEYVPVNDDPALEQEATAMGSKAAQFKSDQATFAKPLQLKSDFGSMGVVQREIYNNKVNDPESAEGAKTLEFFNTVNARAQEAYMYAMTVPSLGAYSGLDGYTRLWKGKWDIYLAGGKPQLMAATFGYVVESLVSHPLAPFKPTAPTGCSIYYQVTVGGTRPDLVLKAGGVDLAWVDLTSEGSIDHIFDKDSWDAKVARYAEVSYPPLDPGSLSFMRQNKDNTGTLSAKEFETRKTAAEEAYKLKKAQWKAFGLKYRYSNAKSGIKHSTENLRINPGLKRAHIQQLLSTDTKVAIEEKLMPSILIAMGVNPVPWGFNLGYSQSEKVGDAWLTDHDPTAPPQEDLEQVEDDNSQEEETAPETGQGKNDDMAVEDGEF